MDNGYSSWAIFFLARRQKTDFGKPGWVNRLTEYEGEARALQSKLLYRVGSFEHEESLKRQIKELMAESGRRPKNRDAPCLNYGGGVQSVRRCWR